MSEILKLFGLVPESEPASAHWPPRAPEKLLLRQVAALVSSPLISQLLTGRPV